MAEVEKKCTKKRVKKEINLVSGNTDYIAQNLEMLEFIKANKCKTVAVKNGKK